MSYRMPFPEPLLPIIVIMVLITNGGLWLYHSIFNHIRQTHTMFAFAQTVEFLDHRTQESFPDTRDSLVQLLKGANIDWNSCSLTEDGILDGWRRVVRLTLLQAEGAWQLCSSGRDGEFHTDDDILQMTKARK